MSYKDMKPVCNDITVGWRPAHLAHTPGGSSGQSTTAYVCSNLRLPGCKRYLEHLVWDLMGAMFPSNIETNDEVSVVQPYIGILSTPVIDPDTNTVYALPYLKEKGNLTYRLLAHLSHRHPAWSSTGWFDHSLSASESGFAQLVVPGDDSIADMTGLCCG